MSYLAELIDDPDRTIVTSELPVIDGGGLEAVRRKVDELRPWVDAINATDNTAAHAHASNVAVAIAIAVHGAEPIVQVVCRDKNRLALEADIVGAALHGVTNVCCLTGDDVTAGDEPQARRVFDLDGPQLVRVASGLSAGHYLSGRAITPAPPTLCVGAVENPGAPPFEYRVRRAQKKVGAGARFLQLQICYDPQHLETFVTEADRAGVTARAALLQTICLTRGARPLRFMDAEVPGIAVPAEIIERVERASDPAEAAYQVALEQARHALALPGVRGLHMVDFRHDGSLARLVAELGVRPALVEQPAAG